MFCAYGGKDSPDDISRGLFAGEVGTPRLLELFRRHDLRTTWFVPGHSIETFPEQIDAIVAAGHEVGVHGYSHENPIAMSREQETEVLDKCIALIEEVTGRRPTGYVAPWWEFSRRHQRTAARTGHQVRPLAHAPRLRAVLRASRRLLDPDRLLGADRDDWMKPLVRGRGDRPRRDPGELVPRRPAADDVHQDQPQLARLRQPAPSRGDVARPVRLGLPRAGLRRGDLHHPPGRLRATQVLLMLERLIAHINGHDGVRWATFDEIADDFLARRPRVTA